MDVSGQKYFELNFLIFLFKLLANLSTENGPYLLFIILKLTSSIDQLDFKNQLNSFAPLGSIEELI